RTAWSAGARAEDARRVASPRHREPHADARAHLGNLEMDGAQRPRTLASAARAVTGRVSLILGQQIKPAFLHGCASVESRRRTKAGCIEMASCPFRHCLVELIQ